MQPLVSTVYLSGEIMCMTVLRSGSHHMKRCRRHASLPEDPPPPLLAAPHRTYPDVSLANDANERVSVVWGSDYRRGLSSRLRNSNCGHSRAPKFKSHPSPPKISDPKIPQSTYTHTFTMASRPVTRALRQSARQLAAAPAQKRTFVSALSAGAKKAAPRAAVTSQFQQTRGVKTIDFAGTKETVYGRFQLDTQYK